MEYKTKKNIAREFIILSSVILLSLLSFLYTFLHNKYIDYKNDRYDSEIVMIRENIENISLIYIDKHKIWEKFNNFIRAEYNMEGENAIDIALYFTERTKNNKNSFDYNNYSVEFRKYLVNYDLKNEKEYVDFMNKYSFSKEELVAVNRVLESQSNLKLLSIKANEFWNNNYHIDKPSKLFFNVLLFLTIIAYPIRGFVYMAIWSIRILRN